MNNRKISIICALIILVITLLIRWYGAAHNYLPTNSEILFIEALERMTEMRGLDSQYYFHPDNIALLLGLLAVNLYSMVVYHALCAGITSHGEQFFMLQQHMEEGLLIVRAMNAFFSVITVALVGRMAQMLHSRACLPAMLAAAIYPLWNEWSGTIMADTMMTTLLAAAMYYTMRFLQLAKNRDLSIAVIFCAACTAQKFPGAISCALVGISLMIKAYSLSAPFTARDKVRYMVSMGLKCAGIYLVSLIVLMPNVVTNIGWVIHNLQREAREFHAGADGLGYWGNLEFYLQLWWSQMGAWSLLVVVGVYHCVRHKKMLAFPAMFSFFFILLLSRLPLHWDRWGLPLGISCCIATGLGMAYVMDWTYASKRIWFRWVFVSILAISCFCIMLDDGIAYIVRSLPDTRFVAKPDLEERIANLPGKCESSWFTVVHPKCTREETKKYNLIEPGAPYYCLSSSYCESFFASEKYSPERYREHCDLLRSITEKGRLMYAIHPWIKNCLLIDKCFTTLHPPYSLPCTRMPSNVRYVCEYIKNPHGKYQGPSIYLYSRVK